MKVICIKSNARDLDLAEVGNIFRNTYDYGLTIGREYLVMGMVIYKRSNCLFYLIDNDFAPRWYPYMLFEISDNRLPLDWRIDVLGQKGEGDLHTLIGFKELCNDDDFYDLLSVERDEKAFQTYYMRKEKTEICTWND